MQTFNTGDVVEIKCFDGTWKDATYYQYAPSTPERPHTVFCAQAYWSVGDKYVRPKTPTVAEAMAELGRAVASFYSQQPKTCECGATACRSKIHSSWCPLA